jgi:hypothetical protein
MGGSAVALPARWATRVSGADGRDSARGTARLVGTSARLSAAVVTTAAVVMVVAVAAVVIAAPGASAGRSPA